MNIYVLNRAFEKVATIDAYSSVIWATRYYEVGDFELYCDASESLLDTMQAGYYLVREQDWTLTENNEDEYHNVMVVSGIEIKADVENGDKLIITGEDLKTILKRRVIAKQTVLTGTAVAGITKLLNENIVSPQSARRQISNFTLGTNSTRTSYTIDMQFTGKVLAEAVSEICQTYGYGYDLFIRNGVFVFYLYEGEDRSFDQSVNPHVVFSTEYDNLISSDYKIDGKTYSNVAYVAGEGEGLDRKIVTVGTASGLDRYELWVDSRNASSNNGEITPTEYSEMLTQEGVEKLSETTVTTAFDGEIDNGVNFKLGEDYFLGDIVQVTNEYGVSAKTRVIEIIDSEDESGHKTVVTFSAWVAEENDPNEYLLTENRAIIMTEDDLGLLREDAPLAQYVATRSMFANAYAYGTRISELEDPTTMSGDYYAPLAKADVATYKVLMPVTKDDGETVWNGRVKTQSDYGYVTDVYGNLKHLRDNTSDYWNIENSSGSPTFKVFFESGEVTVNPFGSSTGYLLSVVPNRTVQYGGIICMGLITSSQTDLYFTIPLTTMAFSSASIRSLSLILRHADGGYIYFRSGTDGATYTAIGASATSVVTNGAATRSNELSVINITPRGPSVMVQLRTTYKMCINNSGTAVTNNTPVAVWVSEITFTTA